MEDLKSFIDGEELVTVRWLANTLSLPSAEAGALMESYKSANPTVTASYLITGIQKESISKSFRFVSETDLEECKKGFSNITSCHIFSLQRSKVPLSTNTLAVQVSSADMSQASELLFMRHPNSDSFLKNKLGRIRSSGITVNSVGQRHLAAQAIKALSTSSDVAGKKDSSLGEQMSKAFATKPTPITKASAAVTANFFGAGSSSSKPKSVASSSSNKPTTSIFEKAPAAAAAAPKPPVAPHLMMPDTNPDDDGEWDDGTGYRPDAEKLKARKAAHGMPVGTGGLHQADVDADAAEEGDDDENADKGNEKKEKKARPSYTSPVKANVHGAMDDYFEDVASAEKEKAPKRKRIKTVEKCYMDDKGFLVTTMVDEEVTDDEAPAPSSISRPKAPGPALKKAKEDHEDENDDVESGKKKAAPKPKPKGKAAPPPAQKGIGSFFGKK